jgi:hypothetical protein
VNSIEYTEIDCPVAGDYQGMNDTNYKFLITAESGTVKITGREILCAALSEEEEQCE